MIDYITSNEVVYQKAYALIDVSNQNNPEQQAELTALINECEDDLTLDVRENLFGTPYEELAQLSSEEDALILIGEQALMCVPLDRVKSLSN